MSDSNIEYASEILNRILKQSPALQERLMLSFSNDCQDVVKSVNSFISERLNKVQTKDEKDAIYILLQACSYQHSRDMQKIEFMKC